MGCEDGAYQCTGVRLERCEGGVMEAVGECETEQLCEDSAIACTVESEHCRVPGSGLCLPAACELGEQRCFGPLHQRCAEGRNGWDTLARCGPVCGGLQCDVQLGCVEAPCSAAEQLTCGVDEKTGAFQLLGCNADCTAYEEIDCKLVGQCGFCAH